MKNTYYMLLGLQAYWIYDPGEEGRDHGLIARIEVGRDERRLFFSEKIMDTLAGILRSLG